MNDSGRVHDALITPAVTARIRSASRSGCYSDPDGVGRQL